MKIYLYVLLAIFVLSCFSCESDAVKNARRDKLIQAEVQRRIDEYLLTRTGNCEARLLEQASEKTDSILMEKAQELIKQDTIAIPNRPIKPGRPKLKTAKDTSDVQPIIPQ